MSSFESQTNPLTRFLSVQEVMILDGGLATQLEARGCDLSDELWSARLLADRPSLIRDVHGDYLRAGADCIISASYQATFEGFMARGMSTERATDLIRSAVELACQARDEFWSDPGRHRRRIRPLVAASVGPYGAYLADGSEFRGDYGLGEESLAEFHRQRWGVLAASGADLLACETLPSRLEARALRQLLESTPSARAWFSFCCADARHLQDGTAIGAMIQELEDCPQVVGVGVNCTSPQYVAGLVAEIRSQSAKPVVVYPNSGEAWDGQRRVWKDGSEEAPSWTSLAPEWVRLGAGVIGGCCRTQPADIADLRRSLLE